MLLELGEKPKIEASRIGLNKPKDKKEVADRPVKVTSSTIVQQILTRERYFRSSVKSSSAQIGLKHNIIRMH